jgi:hypothetical protein
MFLCITFILVFFLISTKVKYPNFRSDNLKMEGQFTGRKESTWQEGERAQVVRREDNLALQGDFTGKKVDEWRAGERSSIVKHQDNLKIQGKFSFNY